MCSIIQNWYRFRVFCLSLFVLACGPEGDPAPDDQEGGTLSATWVRHLGNSSGDRSVDGIAELIADDKSLGYAVVGTSGDGRSWVGVLDHDGGVMWSKAFGGRPKVPLRTQTAAVPTPQGGLLIAGEGTDGRPTLVELDPTGVVLRTTSIADENVFVRAMAARSNSYLIAGGVYVDGTTIVGWVSEVTLDLEPVPWTAKIVPSSQGALWFTAVATGVVGGQSGPYGPGRGPTHWVAVGQHGKAGYIASTIGVTDPAGEIRQQISASAIQFTDVQLVGGDIFVAGYNDDGGVLTRVDYDLTTPWGWPKTVPTTVSPTTASLYVNAEGVWFGVGEKLVLFSQSGESKEIPRSNLSPIHRVRGWSGHPEEPVVVTSRHTFDVFVNSSSAPETGVYSCLDTTFAVPTSVTDGDGKTSPRLYTVGLDWTEKPRTGTTHPPCVYAVDQNLAFEWGSPTIAQTTAAFGVLALPNGDFVAGLSPTDGSVGLVRFTADGKVVWSRFVEGVGMGEGVGWIPEKTQAETKGALVALVRTHHGENPVLLVVQDDGFLLQARSLSHPFSKVSGLHGGKGIVLTDREGVIARWETLDKNTVNVLSDLTVADAVLTPGGNVLTVADYGTFRVLLPDGTIREQKRNNSDSWFMERHVAELLGGDYVDVAVGIAPHDNIYSVAFPSEICLGAWNCTNIDITTSAGAATSYSTLADDTPTGVITTRDGGMLVWGTTRGYVFPNEGAWMLKVNDEGATGGECSAAKSLPKTTFSEPMPLDKKLKWTTEVMTVVSLDESDLDFTSVAVSDSPEQAKSCSGFVITPPVTLTVDLVGEGTVDLVSDPAAISCGDRCWQWPVGGADVTLTASPAEGYVFSSWIDPETQNTIADAEWKGKIATNKTLMVVFHPTNELWCTNGLDDDHDGVVDCDDPDCLDAVGCDNCEPDCNGKQCGDNGCGGSCGSCADGATCVDFGCVVCEPDCNGKQCGDNGCGGSCGSCADGATCVDFQCVACQPDCNGKQCGDNGCGGSCGSCADGATCVDFACVACQPDCNGKQCGDDGCGGSCGNCADGAVCADFQCVDETLCADAPIAVITVSPDTVVTPQTTVYLSGLNSFSPTSSVVDYAWTLTQPGGSVAEMLPSATVADVSVTANVPGTYQFELHVWDENGVMSCVPSTVVIQVIPDTAIHVVLTWDTPGDADQTDEGPEAGADMDLHVAHPLAQEPDVDKDGQPDPWFSFPYDCFWFNNYPNWGPTGPNGDPVLDRDDTDGAGPELISIDSPEVGKTYRVGVHYWDDHGFGISQATLRVYINGEMKFERTGVEMQYLDMWDAITIEWPQGTITPITKMGGGDKITPGYTNPLFEP